ncbi:MAG: hypothetical protein JST87_16365 [Bacteroidetes bacterium]|nr:hypothetical protein [Bacteroidota bacterium]MBS1934571.1 hypothetical protein [Bacteroidota bacterium]
MSNDQPESAQLKAVSYTKQPSGNISYPFVVRFLAHFFSWIFHPLFIASYVMAFLIFVHPYVFAGFDQRLKGFRFLSVFIITAFFPAFSIFLMWRLKLVLTSIYLKTTRERIIPYVLAMIFYWWVWNVFRNLPDSPPVAVNFLFGSFLAVCGAWFCNIYFKISMHAVAVGGMMMFFILFSFVDNYASGLYLSLALLTAGIVCTSRFIVSDHSPFEIYSGLFIGLLTQYIAWQL